jgi:septum formation protein
MMKLILASASPRRLALLRQIGLNPEIVPPVEEELRFTRGGAPEARETARRKGLSVAGEIRGAAVVLAADTIVCLDGVILGKPSDQDAADALRRLSGRAHEVITGVYVKNMVSGRELVQSAQTSVWFKALSARQISGYALSGEGRDKAGGYGIQGLGAVLIERIEGSYSNVVGLPLELTADMLQAVGWDLFKRRADELYD